MVSGAAGKSSTFDVDDFGSYDGTSARRLAARRRFSRCVPPRTCRVRALVQAPAWLAPTHPMPRLHWRTMSACFLSFHLVRSMMLEASIRGEHDDATVTPNLSDMPEVLIPVYEHLRETSRKERFLQAAVIDEDDDFDTEQEEGVDIDTDERTNEVGGWVGTMAVD